MFNIYSRGSNLYKDKIGNRLYKMIVQSFLRSFTILIVLETYSLTWDVINISFLTFAIFFNHINPTKITKYYPNNFYKLDHKSF